MITWRLPESETIYAEVRSKWNGDDPCRMCKIPPTREIGSFVITPNEFPYDAVCSLNDMLALKECAPSLTIEQVVELEGIKQVLGAEGFYDLILENMPRKKTIPGHWHIHLMRLRPLENHEK